MNQPKWGVEDPSGYRESGQLRWDQENSRGKQDVRFWLDQLAELKQLTPQELRAIPGIGRVSDEKLLDAALARVQERHFQLHQDPQTQPDIDDLRQLVQEVKKRVAKEATYLHGEDLRKALHALTNTQIAALAREHAQVPFSRSNLEDPATRSSEIEALMSNLPDRCKDPELIAKIVSKYT